MKKQTHPSRNTILAITSYPNPGSGLYGSRESFSAVCWHSERILTELSKHHTVHVFANIIPDSIGTFSMSEHLHIRRVWKKGSWLSLLALPFRILKLKNVDTVFVQFEFSILGGIIPNLILLLDLLCIRIMGKKIVFEMHQVIEDIRKLEKHIHIHNKMLQWTINTGLRLYYVLIGLVSHNIIVFETELVERLSHYVLRAKILISSIPAATLPDTEHITQSKAKRQLEYRSRDFVIMVFGYINEYKGIDWILNAIKHIPSQRIRLLIAGGPNPYHAHKREYQKYYNSILKRASRDARVRVTGFIPDEDIPMYFQACDLVVLPYQVFMSASGPYSWAISYEKPFILSNILIDYMKSPDLADAMNNTNLTSSDLFFPLKYKIFREKIEAFMRDKNSLAMHIAISHELRNSRSLSKVVLNLSKILSPSKQNEYSKVNQTDTAISSHSIMGLLRNLILGNDL